MNIKIKITELLQLLEIAEYKGVPLTLTRQYPLIVEISKEIILLFGLPLNNEYLHSLISFAYNMDYSDGSVEKVEKYLKKTAYNYHTGNQYEEIELDEEDEKILDRSMESAWKQIKAKREREKNKKNMDLSHSLIVNAGVKDYVIKHLYVPLSDREFEDIETGFRLRWNYSSGQLVGDGDLKRAIDLYLTSIESPMDRKKMEKVVDLMLEYLEEIGEWN